MGEVDYSKFLYNPNKPSNRENATKTHLVKNGKKIKNRSEKSGIKRIIFVATVIILCFGIVFFSVDFFTKGNAIEYVISLMKKESYFYYALCQTYDGLDKAHAGMITSEKVGGAGYLFVENGKYYVVFSIFLSKQDALSVQSKNPDYEVYLLDYSSGSTLARVVDEFVNDIVPLLEKVDAGAYSNSVILPIIDEYVEIFTSQNPKKEEEQKLVGFALECLENVNVTTSTRSEFLYEIRHVVCSLLFLSLDVFS